MLISIVKIAFKKRLGIREKTPKRFDSNASAFELKHKDVWFETQVRFQSNVLVFFEKVKMVSESSCERLLKRSFTGQWLNVMRRKLIA